MQIAEYFYTSGQVAEVLGITRVTVWRWMKEGRFNIQRVGREALIPKGEVDALIEARGVR